ncbi:C3a anaphylatoxin chemotactic receptor-like [Aquarana catesbeiana]|uniref:C3a anaphylatoxin chemotactic receptor-like n=1 Tax=Aquarana catesbeiana TaxID=8400 RepID=UPI003CC96FEF
MEPPIYYNPEHMFTILILSFTALVGVPGNALVLWITGVKLKRTVTTVWFGNLALADIMCCLCLPFIIAQYFYPDWLYALCKILPFVLFFNMYTSVFTLVAISVDRWILVVHPVWARNHRRIKMAWMICLAIWTLSFAMCLPEVIYRKYHPSGNKTFCYSELHMTRPFHLICAMFGFLIPLIIIGICYIHLACKAQNIRFSEVGRKTIKMSISIIVVFFITWAPYHIIGVIHPYNDNRVMHILDLVLQSLAMFNSCVNPILYVFMGKDMKQKLRQSIGELMQNIFRENLLSPPSNEDQRTAEESLPI